ncbi:hypothetical protein V5O48_010740 [Marasmius crinis-equi]|uniref:Uncharacterized protein n=1 Tax=Marasmius crinis-equi TaxID=585013 RepID=A0ABR3F7H6_9AGAR
MFPDQHILDIEDWENYDGKVAEDLRTDNTNTADLKRGFESAFAGELHFDGEFAHAITYSDPPNPCLNLEGLGPIGLPLNAIQADMIMKASHPGTGSERDIWSFPGDLIQIGNPQWDTWLTSTVIPSLHKSLDAPITGFHEAQLKCLSIRAPHALPISPTEDDHKNRYATLDIVLPCIHAGGAIRYSYRGQVRTIDTAPRSATSIIAVSAYSGVARKLDPLQSGHVVCLHYHLLSFDDMDAMPHLPRMEEVSNQLHSLFRRWREAIDAQANADEEDEEMEEDDGSIPQMLMYGLEHEYDDQGFKATTLRGSDRLTLAQIAPFAKAYGFALHFAETEYWEEGDGQTPQHKMFREGSRSCARFGSMPLDYDEYPDYDDFEDDRTPPEDIDMAEVGDTGFALLDTITSLDGMPVILYNDEAIGNINQDDESLTEALYVRGNPKSGQVTSEYEPTGRGATWNARVLIISPDDSPYIEFKPGDIRGFVLKALDPSVSESPTKRERTLVRRLVQWLKDVGSDYSPQDLHRVTACLRNSADRWNDAALFRRVLKACGSRSIPIIGTEGFVSAYQAFQWRHLQDPFDEALAAEQSNVVRDDVISHLLDAAREANDSVVVNWCQVQRDAFLDNLESLKASEVDWVLDQILGKLDPTAYLSETLIPRLVKTQPLDMPMWSAFLSRLHEMARGTVRSSFDRNQLCRLILSSLHRIAETIEPFPIKRTPLTATRMTYSARQRDECSIDDMLIFVESCAHCGAVRPRDTVIRRMWDSREQHDKAHRYTHPSDEYYAGLVGKVDVFVRENSQYRAFFQLFLNDALKVFFPQLSSGRSDSVKVVLRNLDDPLSTLRQHLTTDTSTKFKGNDLKDLAQWVFANYSYMASSTESRSKLNYVLETCVAGMMSDLRGQLYSSSPPSALDYLRFCFEVGLNDTAPRFLRMYITTLRAENPEYIRTTLVPLLASLPTFLAPYGFSLSTGPYSTFGAQVVQKYVRHILEAKPASHIPLSDFLAIGCGCTHCVTHLVPFFRGTQARTTISGKAKMRKHLQQYLEKTRWWGVVWQTPSNQAKLEISKPQVLIDLSIWLTKRNEAVRLLNLLGSEYYQQRALGVSYAWVLGTINGSMAPPELFNVATLSTVLPPLPPLNPILPPLATTSKRPTDATDASSKRPRWS